MREVFTKLESRELTRAKQEIVLFLRLAAVRITDHPEVAPFKSPLGLLVISWLTGLAERYADGEDITKT
jgi:hypothetical protein